MLRKIINHKKRRSMLKIILFADGWQVVSKINFERPMNIANLSVLILELRSVTRFG